MPMVKAAFWQQKLQPKHNDVHRGAICFSGCYDTLCSKVNLLTCLGEKGHRRWMRVLQIQDEKDFKKSHLPSLPPCSHLLLGSPYRKLDLLTAMLYTSCYKWDWLFLTLWIKWIAYLSPSTSISASEEDPQTYTYAHMGLCSNKCEKC